MRKINFINKSTAGTKLFLSILFSIVCMTVLAQHSYPLLQSGAPNPNTPPEILRKLVKHSDEFVRSGVAENPNTPIALLNKLAKDSGYEVRVSVVENPNAPMETLKKLSWWKK